MNEMTTAAPDKTTFDNTIEVFRDYKKLQDKQIQKQRMQGLNDFNLFDIMGILPRREDLHTLFISYLLNPEAGHYQGSLFLELFLKQCIDEKWLEYFAIKGCKVHKEKGKKDIYITDGNNHIIIENKVWARDQWTQIKRYIEGVEGNKYVLYLSPDRRNPSSNSLGDWRIEPEEGKELVKNEERYPFAAISYEKEIKDWLIESRKQIANITNLSTGISQYLEVIDKLYGKYKEKVMKLEKYLEEYTEEQEGNVLKTIKQIHEEYPEYRKRRNEEFWEIVMASEGMKELKGELESKDWKLEWEPNLKPDRYVSPLWIKGPEKSEVLFNTYYDKADYHDLYWGIVCCRETQVHNVNKHKEHFIDSDIPDMLEKYSQDMLEMYRRDGKEGQRKCRVFWYNYLWYATSKGDFVVDEITKYGTIEAAAKKFTSEFIETFHNASDLIVKCNEYLKNK